MLTLIYILIGNSLIHVHDVIRDVERKKERKKERHLRQWKNESCLRWDLNPRHSVFQTDALPTELPRQLSWQGPNQTSHTPVRTCTYNRMVCMYIYNRMVYMYIHV